jgi:DNA-binding response OmpR family regulator
MERIVVIDNDRSMRLLMTSSLQEKGWEAFGYDYAHIDLAIVAQRCPDLIVLDLENVENAGYTGNAWEFLQLLKMDDMAAKIPILITTDFQLPTELRDYLLMRHISVVHRSYDLDIFMTFIHKTFTEASQADMILSGDRTLPILVVDDTEDLRDTITAVLRMEGYRVVTADNGQVALDRVSRANFCLILLDLAMPIMNGYEFLSAYELQLRPHTPVIILSAEDDIQSRVLPSFVVDVLPKPFEIRHLLSRVEKFAQPV